MKILNDIAAAISTELRYLSCVEVMTPIGREIPADQKTAPLVRMFHDTDIPTRILRLEIEEGGEAHKALWREHVIDRDSPSRHKFMGVAIYYVRDINSWRLVNPFKE